MVAEAPKVSRLVLVVVTIPFVSVNAELTDAGAVSVSTPLGLFTVRLVKAVAKLPPALCAPLLEKVTKAPEPLPGRNALELLLLVKFPSSVNARLLMLLSKTPEFMVRSAFTVISRLGTATVPLPERVR